MTDFKIDDYALTGAQDKFFSEFNERVGSLGPAEGSTQVAAWIRDKSSPEEKNGQSGLQIDAELVMAISENATLLSLTMLADQIIKHIGDRLDEQYRHTGNIDAVMGAAVMKKVRHMLGVRALGKGMDKKEGQYD